MATTIGNLGNGTGKIYQVKPSGNIDTYPNTIEVAAALGAEAIMAKIIYTKYKSQTGNNTEVFYDDDYGSRFYLNADVAAPVRNISGALEITNQIIPDTKNYLTQFVVGDDGVVTIARRSRITTIGIEPQTGDETTLRTVTGDSIPNDILIVIPKDPDEVSITRVIIEDTTVDGGNLFLENSQSFLMTGGATAAMFIRKADDSWRQILRPNQSILTTATKTLTAGGGSYYILADATAEAERISSKMGLVVLNGSTTLTSPWTVAGESGSPTIRSIGTTLDIVLNGSLVTTTTNSLTIFGIVIPPQYTQSANFLVRADYDEDAAAWKAKMLIDQLDSDYSIKDFGLGNSSTSEGIRNATNCSAASAKIYRTISHIEGTYGLISLTGELTMNVTLTQNAGSKELINTIRTTWKPSASRTWNFLCPVRNGSGIGAKNCIVTITADTLLVYATVGNGLAVGDIIDLSAVKYIAEL